MEKQIIDRRRLLQIGTLGALFASIAVVSACAQTGEPAPRRRRGGGSDKGGKGGGVGGARN
jgi:hypothetical protein